eukprot:15432635-Alexandrium_andersonii.AAC.1
MSTSPSSARTASGRSASSATPPSPSTWPPVPGSVKNSRVRPMWKPGPGSGTCSRRPCCSSG